MPHQHTFQQLQNAAQAAGGHLVGASLPSPDQWERQLQKLDRYAPGCGALTHVSGFSGRMPCGARLTQLSGVSEQEFCPSCEEAQKQAKNPVSVVARSKGYAVVKDRQFDLPIATLANCVKEPVVAYDEATGEVTIKFKL